MRHPFTLSASLEIERDGVCFLNKKRIELLRRIGTSGSMLAASKEMGMSYQQAWSYVQQMNLLSPLPLVIRKRGGTNGGGAELTSFGRKLIDSFEQLVMVHREYTRKIGDELFFCQF
ncbi:MAG: winged helix-turn-helix domain-containing protein [Bacteroidales bacterium]